MCPEERARLIEDELFLLADSGELPEVAYHSALWCLCADPDGPQLTLTGAEQRQLQDAALRRCQRIILRDLTPAFRDRRLWRGPQRSRCNWARYLAFCRRIGRQPDPLFQMQAAAALIGYLAQELAELRCGARERSSVNCTCEELLAFAEQLGGRLPDVLKMKVQELLLASGTKKGGGEQQAAVSEDTRKAVLERLL